jgi:hypothetical protein
VRAEECSQPREPRKGPGFGRPGTGSLGHGGSVAAGRPGWGLPASSGASRSGIEATPGSGETRPRESHSAGEAGALLSGLWPPTPWQSVGAAVDAIHWR